MFIGGLRLRHEFVYNGFVIPLCYFGQHRSLTYLDSRRPNISRANREGHGLQPRSPHRIVRRSRPNVEKFRINCQIIDK